MYNERFISKLFNGTYHSLVGFGSIGKLKIAKTDLENPTYNQLENHFLTATNCQDTKLAKFCLGVLNKQNIFKIEDIFNLSLKENYFKLLDKEKKYIFIQKISPNIYDFMILYFIDEIREKSEKTTLTNPINLAYVFTLEIKENSFVTKNFNIGFFNKTEKDKNIEFIKDKMILDNLIKL